MDNINLIDIDKIIINKLNLNKSNNNLYFGQIGYYTSNNPLLLSFSNIELLYNLLLPIKFFDDKYDAKRYYSKINLSDYHNLNNLIKINDYIKNKIFKINEFDNNIKYNNVIKNNSLKIKLPIKNKTKYKNYNKDTKIKCDIKYLNEIENFKNYKTKDLNNIKLIIEDVNLNLFEKIKSKSKINFIIEIKNYWKLNDYVGLICNLKEITILNIPKSINSKEKIENNINANDINDNDIDINDNDIEI